LHNEVPGIKLTDEVRGRMRSASGSREQSAAESIQISKELVDTAIEHFNGIYFITPFMRYELIVALVDYNHKEEEASREEILVY
jgi:methionine synthase / methylenetetrahydrofolate reductase(NADPH)